MFIEVVVAAAVVEALGVAVVAVVAVVVAAVVVEALGVAVVAVVIAAAVVVAVVGLLSYPKRAFQW